MQHPAKYTTWVVFYGLLRGLQKADKVLHGVSRDEPLNWVLKGRHLHQETGRIAGLGCKEGRSASSQGMDGQRRKRQGAGTRYMLASFPILVFQKEEPAEPQGH